MSVAANGIHLIAALDLDRAIGRGNALPWRLPADLKRFKALTMGHPVLMGRKTFESIGRALPGRRNLVLSRSGGPFPGAEVLDDPAPALDIAQALPLFVIGGGEIYRQWLPMATHMYLTHVDTRISGADTWFPEFFDDDWHIVDQGGQGPDPQHSHALRFLDYIRR